MKTFKVFERNLDEQDFKFVERAMKSGMISSNGDYKKKFEKQIQDEFNIKYCVTCSSGTAALESALYSLNLNEGDEVIIPSFTIVSCLNSVLRLKLIPRIIDVSYETWCLNASRIKKNITKKTKALIYTHIFGNTDQIDQVSKICKDNNIFLIEDCAESMFSKYKNTLTGTFGDISIFSLYYNKLITAGEGGFIISNNKRLINKALGYINLNFGSGNQRFNHKDIGFNYRITNLQMALAHSLLQKKKKLIDINNNINFLYRKFLDGSKFSFPEVGEKTSFVSWMNPIIFKKKVNISKVQDALFEKKIETRRLFKPLHKMKFLKKYTFYKENSLFNSELIYSKGLYLPSGHTLNHKDVKYIANTINSL